VSGELSHVFLRHPPLPEMRGLCYGRIDVELEPPVFADAIATLRLAHGTHRMWRLPILSSPSLRCRELAMAFARARGDGEPGVDPRLLEMDFGDWEGSPWSAVPQAELDRWADDVAGFRPPNGECFKDVIGRVGVALDELRTPHLIVVHAGVIRAAAHLLGARPVHQAAAIEVAYLQPIVFG
jgi:alpha-ribazole phosphatase